MTRDPIEIEGGVSLYAYVGNGVVVLSDSKGMRGSPKAPCPGKMPSIYCQTSGDVVGLPEGEDEAMLYLRRRFILWSAILMTAVLIYWLAIHVTRPIRYQEGAFREYETSSGVCVQMPNFSIVYDLQCFSGGFPKHIVSPSWAATQEVWLWGRDQDCRVVVRSLTYKRGSAKREMDRWVSDLTKHRALLRERATVSGHPALRLSAPGTLYLFVVWDDAKLLELQADGCRDEEHQRCLRKLIDSLQLR